jgi:hypothetical protein
MEKALREEDITLTHLIGPQTRHAIHPDSAREIERRLAALAVRGRERVPRRVELVTYTLKYNRQHWLTIDGLEKHWEPARVVAEIESDDSIQVVCTNVTAFSLAFEAGGAPFDLRAPVYVFVNGSEFPGARPESDRSWRFHWRRGQSQPDTQPEPGLHKRHGLQGPIDDAFMDRFLVVRPTGTGLYPGVSAWVNAEADRLVREWRRQFRGQALVKNDQELTDDDVASSHLVLFGDPESNSVLKRILNQLPIGWTNQQVSVGKQTFDATHHAPAFIYPNPLNPHRYVVVNSGFTYREYDYLNNARQVPRLPDWAVIDLRRPPDSRYPGRVATAGFFGEQWQIVPP